MCTKRHLHGKMGRGSGQPNFGGKSQLQQGEREKVSHAVLTR